LGVVDVKAYGFYETAGKEDLTMTAFVRPSPAASVTALRYDNLNFYKPGVVVTALNVTAAVDYIGGAVNGQLNERAPDRRGANQCGDCRADLSERSANAGSNVRDHRHACRRAADPTYAAP
jgi:hypothetical protein